MEAIIEFCFAVELFESIAVVQFLASSSLCLNTANVVATYFAVILLCACECVFKFYLKEKKKYSECFKGLAQCNGSRCECVK